MSDLGSHQLEAHASGVLGNGSCLGDCPGQRPGLVKQTKAGSRARARVEPSGTFSLQPPKLAGRLGTHSQDLGLSPVSNHMLTVNLSECQCL